jgi:hypothetical protein
VISWFQSLLSNGPKLFRYFVDADSLKDVGTPDEALERFVELIGAFWNENGFGVPGRGLGWL